MTFDLKINVGHCDIFHGPVILSYLEDFEYEHHTFGLKPYKMLLLKLVERM